MNLSIVKSRVERSNLKKNIGKGFHEGDSAFISNLNLSEDIYFGLVLDDSVFTIVGRKYTYYNNNFKELKRIKNVDLSKAISREGMLRGKNGIINYVELNNMERLWVKNISSMAGIQNILLLLNSI